MASLVIEKQPTNEPVTLAVMKNFLRVTFNNDDLLIQGLIQAARESCEAFTNRSFCTKGYRQCHDAFPYATDTINSQNAMPPSYYAYPRYSTSMWNYSMQIKLFAAPLISVDRITYLAATDQQYHDLVPTPPLWYPGTTYALNVVVMDANGNMQQCTSAGVSDANPPAWATALNATTTEVIPDGGGEGSGPVVWQNMGPLPAQQVTPGGAGGQFGSFMVDPDNEPARIFPGPPGAYWPQCLYVPNAVQVHFTAGFSADGTLVPQAIKTAIMQCVAHWYENREAAMLGVFTELPNHCKALLWAWRVEDYTPTRG